MSNSPESEIAKRSRILIYACSGCSDAGELADRTARILAQKHLGEMSCLAGIGGRVPSFIAKAARAREILVIDGCPVNCAHRTLSEAGFSKMSHLKLRDLGFVKGKCAPFERYLETSVQAATSLLQGFDVSKTAKV